MSTLIRSGVVRLLRPAVASRLFMGMASSKPDEFEHPEGALKANKVDKAPKEVSKEEWYKMLDPERYHVTQEAGTEAPYSGKYDKHMKKGVYNCVCCGVELFELVEHLVRVTIKHSESKFNSGCGWPAFHTAKGSSGKQDSEVNSNIIRITDDSIPDYPRVEIRCKNCNAHLGHVFDDGPKPTGERFCVNSVCLAFAPGTIEDPSQKK